MYEGCLWGGKTRMGKGKSELRRSEQISFGAGGQDTLTIILNCLSEIHRVLIPLGRFHEELGAQDTEDPPPACCLCLI